MAQSLLTASLFQTSLRRWQADWKARRNGSEGSPAPVARRLIGAAKAKRLSRRDQIATGK